MMYRPVIVELRPAPDPERALLALAGRPHCVFLDSALRMAELGRYSFLTADPFAFLSLTAEDLDPLGRLAGELAPFRTGRIAELPPFQGGAAGVLGYELGRTLETIPAPAADEFGVPALAMGLYDVVIAWDHSAGRAWLISQGFPETDSVQRQRRAATRAEQFQAWLREPLPSNPAGIRTSPTTGILPESEANDARLGACIRESFELAMPALLREQLSSQHEVGFLPGLLSNFSANDYVDAVRRAIDYIHAGDVFQVNLSQRLLYPAKDDAVELYLRLRQRNPAPFAGYFDGGTFQLASASPERFLQVRDGRVEARPIKGTRPRTARPEADLFAAADLKTSEKEQAENVMIVDLLRNDLSRVCRPHSVHVSQLCGLESYAYVQHLVSVVRGELEDRFNGIDLMRAAFPGGSVTGAPKIRAMEIIAELEPTARGAYCGALGYIGWDGSVDSNILIRTVTACRGWWQIPVGGGIVAQSEPEREYEETWHKAEGLLRSLRP